MVHHHFVSSIVLPKCTGIAINLFVSSGGTALSGLRATVPIGIENIVCPSNATSPAECEAVAPPESPTCYSEFSAAGVRCIQGTSLTHVLSKTSL